MGEDGTGVLPPKQQTKNEKRKENAMKQQEKNTRPAVGRSGALAVAATRKAEKEKRPVKMKGKDLRCGK